VKVPLDYAKATAQQATLYAECARAGQALNALSGNGPMGLTPDTVRATPEWQTAKRAYQAAFAALRDFNAVYCKRFKRSR